MKLSLQADYAFRTLLYLSTKPVASVREISKIYGISHSDLVKVVKQLERAGYLKTTKGKGGGISLKCPPEKICLADVYCDVTLKKDLQDCFHPSNHTCGMNSACGLKNVVVEAKQLFIDVLGNYSLSDFASKRDVIKKIPRLKS
jgi:Rrf2 family nitric oxide-sensitive transcriptional repressor